MEDVVSAFKVLVTAVTLWIHPAEQAPIVKLVYITPTEAVLRVDNPPASTERYEVISGKTCVCTSRTFWRKDTLDTFRIPVEATTTKEAQQNQVMVVAIARNEVRTLLQSQISLGNLAVVVGRRRTVGK